MGVCPASIEMRTDGVNDGDCAGRACWAVTGTFCEGQVGGKFANKVTTCLHCDFYKLVCLEQGENFQGTAIILDKLKKEKIPI